MSTARLLTTNTLAQAASKVVTVLTTIFIGQMIANPNQGLDKVGYDQYGIIVAYAAYFYIITDFGFNAVATKDISEDGAKTSSYINNLLSLRLVASVGLIMVALALLAFTPYTTEIKLGILVVLATIVTQAVVTNGNILFQVKLQYWQSAIAIISGSIVSLSLAGLAFMAQASLFFYLLALVAGSAVMAFVSLALVNNQVKIKPSFDIKLWKDLFFSAMPLGIAIILNLIYIRAGFMILSFVDSDSYGSLNAAYRIFDVALVLPVFIVNALYPILIQRLQQDQVAFKRLFIKSLWGMTALGLLVAIGVWLTAPLAIDLTVNNPKFADSVTILRWLGVLVPIFFISNLLMWAVIALGKRRAVVVFYAIAAVVSLSLNLWLIPQYQYWGIIAVTGLVELGIAILLASQLISLWNKPPQLPSAKDQAESEAAIEEVLEDKAII